MKASAIALAGAESMLSTVLELTQALLHHRELGAFFQASTEALKKIWDFDVAGLGRYVPERGGFELVKLDSNLTGFSKGVGHFFEARPDTPSGWLLRNRRVLIVDDVEAFGISEGIDVSHWRSEPIQSGMAALLVRGERVVGHVFLASHSKRAFGAKDAAVMEAISPILAVALENAVAFEELGELKKRAELEGEYLRQEIGEQFPVDGMIGSSRNWRSVLNQVRSVATTNSTVLILGETGTGKELVARALHEKSRRAQGPFIKVNCGALTETLIESELFGHERGAFTGAHQRRLGRFELAEKGTLFLDEIGEMPLASQVKLLRALEAREIERVGGTGTISIDVRVVAATNRNIEAEVDAGRFRADLFYRLNVFPIRVPPLRDRVEDVALLAQHYVGVHSKRHGRTHMRLSEDSYDVLRTYPWPGNVRELEHLIERAVILSPTPIINTALYLSNATSGMAPTTPIPTPKASTSSADPVSIAPAAATGDFKLKDSFATAERELIRRALADTAGVIGGRKGAAARLGIKRQTLQSKLKKHGLDPTEFKRRRVVGAK
jgi:formate hydrogenlyase transcriptional activator